MSPLKPRRNRAHLGRIEHEGRVWVISFGDGSLRFHELGSRRRDGTRNHETPLEVIFRRSLKQMELF